MSQEAESRKEKTGRKRGGFLLKLAMFCLASVVLLSIVERQVQIAEKKEQLIQLETQLEVQNQKNQELRRSLEEEDGLGDYAERRARVDLGYARPGEKVFIDMGGE